MTVHLKAHLGKCACQHAAGGKLLLLLSLLLLTAAYQCCLLLKTLDVQK